MGQIQWYLMRIICGYTNVSFHMSRWRGCMLGFAKWLQLNMRFAEYGRNAMTEERVDWYSRKLYTQKMWRESLAPCSKHTERSVEISMCHASSIIHCNSNGYGNEDTCGSDRRSMERRKHMQWCNWLHFHLYTLVVSMLARIVNELSLYISWWPIWCTFFSLSSALRSRPFNWYISCAPWPMHLRILQLGKHI